MVSPILSLDIALATQTGWTRSGNHLIWVGRRSAAQAPYVLYQWSERGVLRFPPGPAHESFHRIPSGTPYHICPLFGFWLASDRDAILLTVRRESVAHYMLAVGGISGGPRLASLLLVCPKCAATFGEARLETLGSAGERFLEFALAYTRRFNHTAALRTCPRCSAVHPLTYGFDEDADTPDEPAVRAAG
jgi:hypothetical protein